ncbi:MAG: Trk family potassium uptake protein [Lachnospiraceae bacterium]|nr:Trk family potassium uptake protein [Lachnospiraceae bacterium]
MSHAQIIAMGYLLVILAGTLVLLLPFATKEGQHTSFSEALFTATSATCVTGLVVVDTASHWTTAGKLIILVMIQVGGLGFMTMGVMFAMLLKRTISLRVRGMLQESMNSIQLGGVVKMARRVVLGTILVEGIGALALMLVFIPQFGWGKGIFFGIFHSVSAFCNAGFDLMGMDYGEYSSFCAYSNHLWVNVVLMSLITIGAIGFFVWNDVLEKKFHFQQYKLHTKLALVSTGIIFFAGSVLFYFFERDGLMEHMGIKETVLTSMFSAVTPRTAGFNTIDTASLSNSSFLLTIVLMFIGGSPGSTAGGVKTVTITVLAVYVWSNLRNETGCNIFGRRLPDEVIKKASNVLMLNLALAVIAVITISYLQPISLRDTLFEVFSAIGTAGMSTGVTRDLLLPSRLVIILLMYCGRIGSMSFALSFTERKKVAPVKLPEENVLIG